MDFSQFLALHEEISLVAALVLLLVYDLFAPEKARRHIPLVACLLMGAHTLVCALGFAAESGLCGVGGLGGQTAGAAQAGRSAFAGMYSVSPAGLLFKNILNLGVLLICMQAYPFLRRKDQEIKAGEFYFLLFATLFGMYLMLSAGHFLLFFVGMETASIPMAALVAFNKYEQRSAEAGAKFILSTAFASGLSFFGLSLIYGGTGSLYFDDIDNFLTPTPLLLGGMVLLCSGLFFKISLVPYHLWAADVYEGAPTPVSTYLSVISKGAGVFGLCLVLTRVFPLFIQAWQTVLYILILLSITVGNLFALRQKNMKRFLAFSSISQAGYIVLGIFSASPAGLSALMYYIFVYILANVAAFGVVQLVEQHGGRTDMTAYNGLYKTNPMLSVALMFALFSLAGIPPFAGFFSKFFIFAATAESGAYALLLVALLNTVISLYYYLLVVKAMFILPPEGTAGDAEATGGDASSSTQRPVPAFKSETAPRIVLTVCTAGILLAGLVSGIYALIHQTVLLG